MTRLPVVTPKEIIRRVQRADFYVDTIVNILAQAGLTVEEFLAL